MTKEFHADGGVFQTLHDIHGDARTLVNEIGAIETRQYDAMGRLTVIVRPARPANTPGNPTGTAVQLTDRYAYDILGQRIQHWNSQLGETVKERTDYDAQGRIIATVDFGGTGTTTSYEWQGGIATTGMGVFGGWLKTTVNVAGRTMTEKLDLYGRTVDKVDYGAHDYAYAYDAAGRLVTQTNSAGQNLTYGYYNTGQIAAIVDGDAGGTNKRSLYSFDAAGNLLTESYGTYYGATLTTSHKNATVTWDALGRMLTFDDTGPGGTVPTSVDWEYDLVGNIRRVRALYRTIASNGSYGVTNQVQDYWYRYDSMNRAVVVRGILQGARGAAGTIVRRGMTGMDILWNEIGQRVHETETITVTIPYPWGSTQHDIDRRHYYAYTPDGYLATVHMGTGSPTYPYASPTPAGNASAHYVRDAMGRVTTTIAPTATTTQIWNARSELVSQTRNSGGNATTTTYEYNLESSPGSGVYTGAYQGTITRTRTSSSGVTTDRKTYYTWWDTAQQLTVTVSTSAVPGTTNNASYNYDNSGVLTSATIQSRNVTFVNDAGGHVLQRHEPNLHEVTYSFGGKTIGSVSSRGMSDPVRPTVYADFDQSLASAAYALSDANGAYTVVDGDSLQSIAEAMWGDANLWYKLAETNGLAWNASLTAGQTLIVPQGVASSRHAADTFRPYDPNKAWGDLNPSTPAPPARDDDDCGVFGQILLVAVAVAVTVASHGTLSGALGPVLGGAAAGAAGSVASQAFGLATGLQQGGFSWKGVALAAIGGGVGAGVGEVVGKGAMLGSKMVGDVVRGALGSAVTQGVAVATKLQSNFDWAAVAAAGIGAGVGGAISRSFNAPGSNFAKAGQRLAIGTADAIVQGATRSLVEGTSFGDNLIASLPSVIGNTIGNMVADGIAGRSRTGPINLLEEVKDGSYSPEAIALSERYGVPFSRDDDGNYYTGASPGEIADAIGQVNPNILTGREEISFAGAYQYNQLTDDPNGRVINYFLDDPMYGGDWTSAPKSKTFDVLWVGNPEQGAIRFISGGSGRTYLYDGGAARYADIGLTATFAAPIAGRADPNFAAVRQANISAHNNAVDAIVARDLAELDTAAGAMLGMMTFPIGGPIQAGYGPSRAALSTIVPIGVRANQLAGASREALVRAELAAQYPAGRIMSEVYLRSANGKRAIDPLTGTARRIDSVVIQNGRVLDAVEVTSMNANKTVQLRKELRIRNNGDTFVRDRASGQLIDISGTPTRTVRKP
ncbi:LysM peptidoglycan-binding domain-containing protein [Sphingomonas gilva]|uniref:LysM peptidoglycan-binding domain-containing protein n=1 Tax=Sphingomonas gilva TaxID=2305907 RepID=UPI001CA41FE2|nr:LysM peptidoglycan-binding domain-containing protein [Sphingomonas gilva]